MVRPGLKVAIGFAGSFAVAWSLKVGGIIEDDPLVVYTYSALLRDLLFLAPQAWEDKLDEWLGAAIDGLKRMFDRLCPRRLGEDNQLPV